MSADQRPVYGACLCPGRRRWILQLRECARPPDASGAEAEL